MNRMLNEVRFARMVEVVDSSIKPMQKEHRAKLLVKLMTELDGAHKENLTESELFVRLWQDPTIWVLAFLDDEQGRPLFLSEWQCRFLAMYNMKRRLMGLMTRKAGKSTVLAALLSWTLCSPQPIRAVAFSPSEGQSFIYDKCRTYVSSSPYLRDTFLSGSDAKNTDSELRSNSGSMVIKGYVSQNTKGEQARGQYGDVIVVDEVQSIAKSILDEIIEPMVADAFSEIGSKKLIYIGTPHTKANPELPEMWDRYRKKSIVSNEYGTFTIDCWAAVEQGCIDESYVREQEETMYPDVFAREYLAVFPALGDGYMSRGPIMKCVNKDLSFQQPSRRADGHDYVIGVDWAKQKDRTQMVVARIDRGRRTITYVDWLEFDHSKGNQIDYKIQVAAALKLFWKWDCRWFISDTSGTQDMILDWVRNGIDNQRGVPDYKIYGYDAKVDKSKQKLGYRATYESNYNMYVNHKYLIMDGQIIIPGKGSKEKIFVDRFVKEMTEMVTIETSNGPKFEKPKGGFKDLVSATAMISMLVKRAPTTRASNRVATFGKAHKRLSRMI